MNVVISTPIGAHETPATRSLTPRARIIEGCTPRQRSTIKSIIKDLSQLAIFGMQAANVGTLPRAGTPQGGARFPEANMRAFERHLRPGFEDIFETYAPEVRHAVARRLRYLKYETDRTEGNVLGHANGGRLRLTCDNRLRNQICRQTEITIVSQNDQNLMTLVGFARLKGLVPQLAYRSQCPRFFTLIASEPTLEVRDTQHGDLGGSFLLFDSVARDLPRLAYDDRFGNVRSTPRFIALIEGMSCKVFVIIHFTTDLPMLISNIVTLWPPGIQR